ncbi:hypothetical protein O181_088511 [Austropuccinia psidii MF-1]|uniref:Uncharacterized protein n=1 Tax=Austropuccinia psidii MF-1 TaxID=1389203 RepID=A0A9Q3P709_9BASI|nr:hypothetical protein [Austropuccinia psidii MF-1]
MRNNNGFQLDQTQLIWSIVYKYWGKQNSPAVPLPVKHNLCSLTHEDDSISSVGALSYVATGMHPDIAFTVNLLEKHPKYPAKENWFFLQHFLGYLDWTSSWVLSIHSTGSDIMLNIHSDATWGGEFSWVPGQIVWLLCHGAQNGW